MSQSASSNTHQVVVIGSHWQTVGRLVTTFWSLHRGALFSVPYFESVARAQTPKLSGNPRLAFREPKSA